MLKGIANTETVKFSLKDDTDNPTIFYIKNLSDEAMGNIIDRSKSTHGKDTVELMNEIMLTGLTKIENLNGETIEPVTRDCLKRFNFKQKKEVTDAIQNFNVLGEVEIKN